jgi:hypothetical protein
MNSVLVLYRLGSAVLKLVNKSNSKNIKIKGKIVCVTNYTNLLFAEMKWKSKTIYLYKNPTSYCLSRYSSLENLTLMSMFNFEYEIHIDPMIILIKLIMISQQLPIHYYQRHRLMKLNTRDL